MFGSPPCMTWSRATPTGKMLLNGSLTDSVPHKCQWLILHFTQQHNSMKICKFYNEGTCSYENHHGLYKHIFGYCDRLGRVLQHPEVKCNIKNIPKDRLALLWGGRGAVDNDFLCKSNICSTAVVVYDSNVNTFCKRKINLKSVCELDRGKYAFKNFDEACDSVDFPNTINSDSSLSSANEL